MENTTEKNDWMNEHGEPDFNYLNSLVQNAGPEAQERLRSIAEDLDIELHENDSLETIVDKIRSATQSNEAVDPIMTS